MQATTTTATQEFIGKEARFGARNYQPVPVVVDHARDCLVWDVEGREYVDMMSAYSAVSHGHLHPRLVAAAMQTATFDAAARGKGLLLQSTVAGTVPPAVIGDPVAMRQILSNLVGNAVKFTSEGSVTVTVETTQVSTDAVTLACAVTDTGIGMSPDEVERIFNEFTQASYETAMRFGGSGLGLTITRRLLDLYGSTVQVRSMPGEGSSFSFNLRLPLPPDERP